MAGPVDGAVRVDVGLEGAAAFPEEIPTRVRHHRVVAALGDRDQVLRLLVRQVGRERAVLGARPGRERPLARHDEIGAVAARLAGPAVDREQQDLSRRRLGDEAEAREHDDRERAQVPAHRLDDVDARVLQFERDRACLG